MIPREDIENRLRADMRSTLNDYGVTEENQDNLTSLVEALVEDAMFQIEHFAEQRGISL